MYGSSRRWSVSRIYLARVEPRTSIETPLLTLLLFCSTFTDLEWKLTYVGSAESESFDQELDTCMVGPVPVGINSFEFEVSLPFLHSLASFNYIPQSTMTIGRNRVYSGSSNCLLTSPGNLLKFTGSCTFT